MKRLAYFILFMTLLTCIQLPIQAQDAPKDSIELKLRETLPFPNEPYETRIFRLENKSGFTFQNASSDTRHPPETEGKNYNLQRKNN